MVETELKFQVPRERRAAVARAVATTRAERIRLQARYFDTADARLADAGLALRLRREGRSRWVQTLKGRGDGQMQRLEHGVVLPARGPVALDLARHDGTPAGAALRAALGQGVNEAVLEERFATDILRTRRAVTAGAGQRVELAFDEGFIVARGQRAPVCELEFELLAGTPAALLALAMRWVARHGLWLDVTTKAERGAALASASELAPPVRAAAPVLGPRMPPRRALAGMVQSCLAQMLPNMAGVASHPQGMPVDEHVHQLRIAIRRLRTALREFGTAVPAVDPAWDAALAATFSALGEQRDRDIVAAVLAQARTSAQADGFAVSAPTEARSGDASAADAPRGRAFNQVLLALIGLVMTPPDAPDEGPALRDVATKRLRRLHRRIGADIARIDSFDDAQWHRLRKRLKRLRYSIEFVAPLYPRKAVARLLEPLRAAQEVMGQLNDVTLALALSREDAPPLAGEAFVRGWLVARRMARVEQATERLQRLAAAPRFWRAR